MGQTRFNNREEIVMGDSGKIMAEKRVVIMGSQLYQMSSGALMWGGGELSIPASNPQTKSPNRMSQAKRRKRAKWARK